MSCYNVFIMTPQHEYQLEQAGFELAGPDIWAKMVGEGTTFIELTASGATAWIWLSEAETYLGPKLDIAGPYCDVIPAALHQLQALLAEEDCTASLPRGMSPDREAMRAPVCAE